MGNDLQSRRAFLKAALLGAIAAIVPSAIFQESTAQDGRHLVWSHTVAAGKSRLLLVATAHNDPAAPTLTFKGESLTLAAAQSYDGGTAAVYYKDLGDGDEETETIAIDAMGPVVAHAISFPGYYIQEAPA